ncbi:RHO GTPase-activating protein Rgd1p [Trichomonascus vanleenenianus]|uniref:RHO GTPase-activating protein Rgd1p n=1 Tax=Trichomonascus vanleenenianus TaxID=2268995 RepID=UPI003ECA411C
MASPNPGLPATQAPPVSESLANETENLSLEERPAEPEPPKMAASTYLLEDPRLKEIMLSDVGVTALLARLKQSIVSAREFATFVRKKAQLESENQAAIRKLSRATRQEIKKPEGRQGTFVKQFDEIVRCNERVADVGNTYVAALHKMHDELSELARTVEKSRKSTKEAALRHEKNLTDAEQAAEKAKSKYDSLAEDFERLRMGDPTRNKLGFKQSRTPQHEEESHKKVMAAEAEYKQRVEAAQRLRAELENKLRPQNVKELKELTMEIDSGMSLQLQKYANLNETLALNTGFIISPLQPTGSNASALPMREMAAKVDNELDFYNYVLQIPKTKKLNRPVLTYRQHPSLARAYPTSASTITSSISSISPAIKQTSSPLPSSSLPSSSPTSGHQKQPSMATGPPIVPPVSVGAPPIVPPPTSAATVGPPTVSPTMSPPNAGIPDQAYPPGTTSSAHHLPVYGTPLEELLDYEESTVPRVVYQCVQAVDSFGLEVEGIYRHSGNAGQIAEIKRLFNADSASVDLINPSAHLNDIHAVASALKQYFRELPDSLLTEEFYQEFVDAAKIDNDVQRRDAIHATVNKLPDPNYTTLRYLVFHLYRVQSREVTNRMSIENLSLVWGPTLMSSAKHTSVSEITIQNKVVATIIYNAYIIFDADE